MNSNDNIESLILLWMMKEKGFSYISKNIPLTELFISTNADIVVNNSGWRNLVLNQTHVNPSFFDQFHKDMDNLTRSMLYRKKIMFKIFNLLKRS